LEVVEKFPVTRALRRREASLRDEETVLSLTGGTFSEDLAEDLFFMALFLLEGWRTIVGRDTKDELEGEGKGGTTGVGDSKGRH
jgi:hypothetical protein